MPDVVLKIDAQTYGGWESVVVTTSMEQLAGTFELAVSDRWPGQLERAPIKKGAPCTLHYGDHLLITGYVDEVAPAFDAQSHSIRVAGRDKTADLVDCHHVEEKVEWKGERLLTIAQEVCRPFGVKVAAEGEQGDALALEKYNQGDTIHAMLLRLARKQSMIMVSYGDGRLVFTRAGKARMPVALVEGINIKSGRGQFSNKDRFSSYHVKSSGITLNFDVPLPGSDMYEAGMELFTDAAAPKGEAVDPGVSRHRPMIVLAETSTQQGAAERRAKWEAASRAGRSNRVRLTVQGWEATPGTLWRINRLVPVQCPLLGLEQDQLIESVNLRLDNSGGTTAELGLVHPDAYLPEPLTPATATTALDWSSVK